MEKKIYLVLKNGSYDYEGYNDADIYSSKEEAVAALKECAAVEKNDNKEWFVAADTDEYFCIHEEGDYTRNHVEMKIVEKTIWIDYGMVGTARVLEEFINNFGADMDGLADKMASTHPTLQQKYYSLCAKFIKRMAEKTYTDARNEFAASQCKKLYDVLKETGCGMDGTGAPCI